MATAKKAKSKPKKKAPAKKPAISRKAAPSKKKSAAKKPAVKKAVVKKAAAKPAVKPAVKPPPAKQAPVVQPAAKLAAPRKKMPVVTLSAVAIAPRGTPKSNAATAVVPEHSPLPSEDPVGIVTHYFNHLSVAVVQLDVGSLEVGDTIRFLGHTTDFRQRIDSLEVNHQSVTEVGRRQAFGLKVKEHVREHDVVYKVAAD